MHLKEKTVWQNLFLLSFTLSSLESRLTFTASHYGHFMLLVSKFKVVLIFKDKANFNLLLKDPPKSQSHGLQPARSLLSPQYSGCRDGDKAHNQDTHTENCINGIFF